MARRGEYARYAMCVRFVDCFNDGIQHLFISRRSDWEEGAQYPSGIVEFFENVADPDKLPVFKEPVLLRMANGEPLVCLSGSGSADICDWNGDGVMDVIMEYSGPVSPTVRFFENVGNWVFEDRGIPEGLDDPLLIGRRVRWIDTPSSKMCFCSLVFRTTDGRVNRYRVVGKSENGLPRFEAIGYLEGYGCSLSAGVYSVPYVCDWDGDVGRDIVVGCDHGPVWLIRNQYRDLYDPPEVIRKIDGSMVELRLKDYPNKDFVNGMHGEMYLGMSKPQVVDWNNTGKLDILVSGLCNHLLLFNKIMRKRHISDM